MTPIDTAPPAKTLLAREILSFAYMRAAASFAPPVPLDVAGAGQIVLVVPGFMASDRTTARLRHSLTKAGFAVHGWGLGRNRGTRADTLDRLDDRITLLGLDAPITLVGWSLGGLIAREYAKFAPHRVAKVVSLGSPFSGNPRANNAWRAYELIAGHKVDAPPIDTVLGKKPPVPTTAFWSKYDGVVAPASARGEQHESDYQVELDCSHMAFVARPDAIRAIARAIVN
jgi:pimeloyl-ACP methyl ester carboxylesterase